MIDRLTIERIKEASNIVEVVSEFVTLRRAGINYKGLCPFHEEKTPSFIVSPARGTCHCFGCGKGGNAVSFIMEHEQLSYPDALKWLARKYGIEVHEKELSDQERQEQNEREAMFIINEWAATYFEKLLHDDPDGVAVGMQYYRGRGFRDDVIAKFRLGYDSHNRHALAAQAKKEGYKEEMLLKTGICYQNDRGELIDRYSDRVVFPWIGLSGKVVGFSARLLDTRTKGVNQKYVNSPDSDVYHKDRELFGIYQAKKAIAREDRVFIVEGQTDVISMFQCGIENVVANSGTALSTHQIHTLHRFTDNITLLYDGDEAGIHAALRGTDMLLSEGMNVKVLFLPDGDDPDSFARKNTAKDFRDFVEKNQTDFIQFKIDLLLRQAKDPQQRSEAIDSIVQSISFVPNQILRDTYLHDSATRTGVKELTLINRMNTFISQRKRSNSTRQVQPLQPQKVETGGRKAEVEKIITQIVIRHGEHVIYKDVEDNDGNKVNVTLAQFVYFNLDADNLRLDNAAYQTIIDEAAAHGTEEGFIAEKYFIDHDDVNISRIAADLSVDKYYVEQPKPQTEDDMPKGRYAAEDTFTEKLRQKIEHLMLDFRMEIMENRIQEVKTAISKAADDPDRRSGLLQEFMEMQKMRNELAKKRGQTVL